MASIYSEHIRPGWVAICSLGSYTTDEILTRGIPTVPLEPGTDISHRCHLIFFIREKILISYTASEDVIPATVRSERERETSLSNPNACDHRGRGAVGGVECAGYQLAYLLSGRR